jgi:hypothetical protein
VALVSDKCKLIFVHIPKCAGASVGNAVQFEDTNTSDIDTNIMITKNKHATMDDCKHFLSYTQYNEYHKFAVIRNPWDRASSWYHFRMERTPNPEERKLNFVDWLKTYAHNSWEDTWFGPSTQQTRWLNDDIDQLIRYENLQEEIKTIPNIDLKVVKRIHQTKNSDIDYRDMYDDESKALVDHMYKNDIDTFKYTF